MSSVRPDSNKITLGEIVGQHLLSSANDSEKNDARTTILRDQARRILHENIDIADRKFNSSGKAEVLQAFDDYFLGIDNQTIQNIQQMDEGEREGALEQMAKNPATKVRQRIRDIVIAERAKKAR